jgi:hypothetical protein
MKKSLTLILVLCLVASFSFAQKIDISTAKSSLNASATDLDQLLVKIDEIKIKGEAAFVVEEASIASKKAELQKRRTELEAGNAKEKNMTADEWPARVLARETLVREEAQIAYDAQVLSAKKADFSHRIKQVEQHIQSSFVEVIKTQNNQNDSVMKAYLNALSSFQM